MGILSVAAVCVYQFFFALRAIAIGNIGSRASLCRDVSNESLRRDVNKDSLYGDFSEQPLCRDDNKESLCRDFNKESLCRDFSKESLCSLTAVALRVLVGSFDRLLRIFLQGYRAGVARPPAPNDDGSRVYCFSI